MTSDDLEDDETLLVQSGKPVGVLRTHEWAPRVLIANSNLVGDWADWEHFRHLEAEGAYPLRDTAYSLLCTQSDVERARELSAALIEAGGSEGMPIRKAPWGDYYGQTFDRYCVMGSFSVPAEGPAQAD